MLSRRTFAGTLAGGLLLPAFPSNTAPAAAAPPANLLRPELAGLARFIGTWRGEGSGEPGDSSVERSYEPILGGKFLQARNRSLYPPQGKNPKGETHEDFGLFSFDKARKLAVLRQFHVESFVNQYVAPPDMLTATVVQFETEAIENIPAGFRARETWRFEGDDRLEEIFEIAEPGKEFAVYSHSRLRRL